MADGTGAPDLTDRRGSLHGLGLNQRLVDVLTGAAVGSDQIGLRRGKALVLNRMSITRDDRTSGPWSPCATAPS